MLFDEMAGSPPVYAALSIGSARFLFPDNVDCRDYDKTSVESWRLRSKKDLDLGNWDQAFSISGRIAPRMFVRNGIDLYEVLEAKCGTRVTTLVL